MPSNDNNFLSLNNLEPQKILKNLFEQRAEGIFCDIKLCLQGSVIWGHACVLAPLSPYIMELLNKKSGTTHFCPQKPLEIDLDIVITISQDKCALCLSTLVDFMYSQDLAISDGHLQHFTKMIYYLKVFDLFPLLNAYFKDENIVSLSKAPILQEFSVDSISNSDLLTTKNDQFVKLLTPLPKINQTSSLSSGISEITNSYQEQPDEEEQLKISHKLNQSCDQSENLFSCSENALNSIVKEHNYGVTLKQKCEFLCCSGDVVSSDASKNHRRKIRCEICSFTAVSVKKVIKHVESLSHLGTKCPICTQKFQSEDCLQKHLKDHINSKPYLCQFCSKRTRFWEFYRVHLKVHCRNKQFYCEICQRSFKSQQNLKEHLKNHKTNYLCNSCNYLTSDADAFKVHLLIHKDKEPATLEAPKAYDNFKCISDNDVKKHKTAVQFLCSSCGEGFTQKSNLKRHFELKHSDVPNFHCSKCTYVTKRRDLLKSHMKRHHNCQPEVVKGPLQRVTKRVSKQQKLDGDQSEVVGVLIPVQLVSTNDSSTLNAFAVKSCLSGESESVEDNCRKKFKLDTNENDSCRTKNASSIPVLKQHPLVNNLDKKCCMNNYSSLETLHPLPCLVDCMAVKDSSGSLLKNNETCLESDFRIKRQDVNSIVNNLQLNLNTNIPTGNKSNDLTQPVVGVPHELDDLEIALQKQKTNLNCIQVEPDLLTRNGDFWLNEATGEFLNENSLVNVQMIDTSCRFKTVQPSAKNPHESMADPLHSLILSDGSKSVSILDLRDDVDEFKSNPQTPQTNLVEVDDPENLFPWSCIDSSFCSTWVLNEATGELDMVSFNVQPIKHSDDSKLDESTGMFSPDDDDETALFLNEGTGDLSVIYFNPSNRECDSSKQLYNEQGNQDVPDNISEHSNDADDFLNAEFFEATASFMAHKENEIFLNELTGEFDTNIADFNNYHPDLLENQICGNESYLNEETGEILWNVLNKNVGSDFFTSSESFKYDRDDSLNCDDFEPFADGLNNFSSQFCLEAAQDWQSVDETCDILLNECTGELIKKS